MRPMASFFLAWPKLCVLSMLEMSELYGMLRINCSYYVHIYLPSSNRNKMEMEGTTGHG